VKSIASTASSLLQSPTVRRILQVLSVALILLFFGLAAYSQLPQIVSYNWVLDPVYLALALLFLLLRGPAVVYGFWSIMRLLGHPLPFPTCIRIGYHSALARYLPGQMWYAVSRVYLAEKEGVPRVITAVGLALETAMVVVGAVVVSSLSLLVWRDAPVWAGLLVLVAILGVVSQPKLLFAILNWGLTRIGRKPVEVQLRSGDMLRLLWPFTLNWLHYGLMSFLLLSSLYPRLPWSQAPAIGGIFTVSWLIGFLAIIVPQGLVVRETVLFTLLTTLIGVPAPVATATAILSRAFTMLGEAIWAGISTRF
jgi:glycosyltransferase 2 family protein